MRPDYHGGRRDPDNPVTKEEAAMKALAGNDNGTMSKMMIWTKNLLMVQTVAEAQVTVMAMAATKVYTQAMAAK